MGILNPTPIEVLTALRDHGVPVKPCKGWDTVGREWKGPNGSPGLMGVINHHTSTPSAVGSSGAPTLEWLLTAFSKPAANMLIGRGKNDSYLASAGSCYHSGLGGPGPSIGCGPRYHDNRDNDGHYRLFGIEYDDPGTSRTSLTDEQLEYGGRTNAGIIDLTGNPIINIWTHTCWTDGCHGMNPYGPSLYVGRKDDTLGDGWGTTDKPVPYNAPFWREQARRYLGGGAPLPPVREEEDEVVILIHGRTNYFLSGGTLCRISQLTADKAKAAGVKAFGVDQADWEEVVKQYGGPNE